MNHPCGQTAARPARRTRRRRAYLLGQMVTVLPLLLVVGSLAAAGIIAGIRTQTRSAEIANGYTAINSLLDTLRQDARAATTARMLPGKEGPPAFVLETPDGRIRYHFAVSQVTRRATDADVSPDARREWRIKDASLTAELDTPAAGSPLLTVHIRWRGRSKHDVDPTHRFDASFAVGRGYQP